EDLRPGRARAIHGIGPAAAHTDYPHKRGGQNGNAGRSDHGRHLAICQTFAVLSCAVLSWLRETSSLPSGPRKLAIAAFSCPLRLKTACPVDVSQTLSTCVGGEWSVWDWDIVATKNLPLGLKAAAFTKPKGEDLKTSLPVSASWTARAAPLS